MLFACRLRETSRRADGTLDSLHLVNRPVMAQRGRPRSRLQVCGEMPTSYAPHMALCRSRSPFHWTRQPQRPAAPATAAPQQQPAPQTGPLPQRRSPWALRSRHWDQQSTSRFNFCGAFAGAFDVKKSQTWVGQLVLDGRRQRVSTEPEKADDFQVGSSRPQGSVALAHHGHAQKAHQLGPCQPLSGHPRSGGSSAVFSSSALAGSSGSDSDMSQAV
jgi:hypothetical protein